MTGLVLDQDWPTLDSWAGGPAELSPAPPADAALVAVGSGSKPGQMGPELLFW